MCGFRRRRAALERMGKLRGLAFVITSSHSGTRRDGDRSDDGNGARSMSAPNPTGQATRRYAQAVA